MAPIKPENRHHYRTPEWREARAKAMERAGETWIYNPEFESSYLGSEACCEFCEACNHSLYDRVRLNGNLWQRLHGDDSGPWEWCDDPTVHAFLSLGDAKVRTVKIVLTVAHLDHDPTNNALDNLRALCQRCHNRHDAKHRAANAAKTRARKKAQP